MHSRTFAMYSIVQCQCQCLLMCVTPVHACRWGLRVQCDDRRRGQQAHHLRQLETGELVASHIGHSVLFPSYNCSAQSLSLPCSGDLISKPASASSCLNILCLYLRNGGKEKEFAPVLWRANDLCWFEWKECVSYSCFCVSLRIRWQQLLSLYLSFFWSSLKCKSGNQFLVNLTCFNSNLQFFGRGDKNCCGYASSTSWAARCQRVNGSLWRWFLSGTDWSGGRAAAESNNSLSQSSLWLWLHYSESKSMQ